MECTGDIETGSNFPTHTDRGSGREPTLMDSAEENATTSGIVACSDTTSQEMSTSNEPVDEREAVSSITNCSGVSGNGVEGTREVFDHVPNCRPETQYEEHEEAEGVRTHQMLHCVRVDGTSTTETAADDSDVSMDEDYDGDPPAAGKNGEAKPAITPTRRSLRLHQRSICTKNNQNNPAAASRTPHSYRVTKRPDRTRPHYPPYPRALVALRIAASAPVPQEPELRITATGDNLTFTISATTIPGHTPGCRLLLTPWVARHIRPCTSQAQLVAFLPAMVSRMSESRDQQIMGQLDRARTREELLRADEELKEPLQIGVQESNPPDAPLAAVKCQKIEAFRECDLRTQALTVEEALRRKEARRLMRGE